MAVLAHDVHERTREAAGAVWGCHRRPEFAAGYWAPDRMMLPSGKFEVVQRWIPHFGSTECRNDVSLSDAKCEGCPRRGSGEAYSEMVRSRGQA
jgi:hypothetical protein